MKPIKVFVYGTLKKGYHNHHHLGTSSFLGEAVTQNTYTLTDCGFPYLIPDSDGLPVVGEVYLVDDPAVLMSLDALEGVAYGHYEHHATEVLMGEEVVDVLAYTPVNRDDAYRYTVCNKNEKGQYVWGN